MNEILNMSINEMTKKNFDCSCGRHHILDVEHIAIGKGTLTKLVSFAQPFRKNPVLMISDNHTFKAAGKSVLELLEKDGFDVINHCFETEDEILIPNESIVGSIMMELLPETSLLICVGAGTLNDVVKYISARTKIPYIIVCTAPSTNGYVSNHASLIREGKWSSFCGTFPYAVVGDTDIMKEAPMSLIRAGFGDMLGTLTALADWRLAAEIAGEECCETCISLVQTAVNKAVKNAQNIVDRQEEAILSLIEALTLSGIAMALVKNLRPAFGSEHLLSHYWEMEALTNHRFLELHGIRVGIATSIIAQLFEILEDDLPDCAMELVPSKQELENILKLVGSPTLPTEIGIDRKLFYDSLVEAWMLEDCYSILQLAAQKCYIEEIAKQITDRIYGEEN